MKIQNTKVGDEKIIESGAATPDIGIHHSGIAKVIWHQLNTEVPTSEVVEGGVYIYK